MTDYEELYDDLLDEFYELKAENKGLIKEFINKLDCTINECQCSSDYFESIMRHKKEYEEML